MVDLLGKAICCSVHYGYGMLNRKRSELVPNLENTDRLGGLPKHVPYHVEHLRYLLAPEVASLIIYHSLDAIQLEAS